jgi:D-alanyl-D-alanine carboxypeptidase (penicillin-binding protein 5/6)
MEQPVLNALSACLIDAQNGRVLYEKNGYDVRAMASTTKIMTLTIALEQGNPDDIVTISQNAARQPDVQLNVNTGEQYRLKDLFYSLMLESHNDVAVAIAEHVGGSVEGFAALMNEKAQELGCVDTHFVTPNGLDASDEGGKHATTAVDLARIAAYAIQNETFVEIINTRSYSFQEVNGKRSFTVNNKDAFLDMMDGAFGIKTGFTGDAGYCFVGAVKQDERTFISVVLASGWPPNKTYKWNDTKKLMQLGIQNYFPQSVYEGRENMVKIAVTDGIEEETYLDSTGSLSMLLSEEDEVKVYYEYPASVPAPVVQGEQAGSVHVYVNGENVGDFPMLVSKSVRRINFRDYFERLTARFLP